MIGIESQGHQWPPVELLDERDRPRDCDIFGIRTMADAIGITPRHFRRLMTAPNSCFHLWPVENDLGQWATSTSSLQAGWTRHRERVEDWKRRRQANLIRWIRSDPSQKT